MTPSSGPVDLDDLFAAEEVVQRERRRVLDALAEASKSVDLVCFMHESRDEMRRYTCFEHASRSVKIGYEKTTGPSIAPNTVLSNDARWLGITTEDQARAELDRYVLPGSELALVVEAMNGGRIRIPSETDLGIVSRGGEVLRIGVYELDDDFDLRIENLFDEVYDPQWGYELGFVIETIADKPSFYGEITFGTTLAALTGAPKEWSRSYLSGRTV